MKKFKFHSDHTADTVNGLIYITGGCNGIQLCDLNAGFCSCTTMTDNVLLFDPSSYQFTTLPSMPAARYRHTSCVWRDTIYVFGGRTLPDDNIIYEVFFFFFPFFFFFLSF
jgi:hypothetical protein